MPFYRFENLESKLITPRLSTAQGPIIEGDFIYFCLNSKEPGTGSQVHYHPNELLIFPTVGKINSLVGKDRRIVPPGTFIHIPPSGQHQMSATEDEPLSYLYIKDKTWTVIGVGVEEALPDKATPLEEATEQFEKSGWKLGEGEVKAEAEKSSARVEGLGNCYYPIISALDAPPASGNRHYTFEGERMVFGFSEIVTAHHQPLEESAHEQFIYVITGSLDARVDDEQQEILPGGIIHIPKGARYSFSINEDNGIRFVSASSTSKLESALSS